MAQSSRSTLDNIPDVPDRAQQARTDIATAVNQLATQPLSSELLKKFAEVLSKDYENITAQSCASLIVGEIAKYTQKESGLNIISRNINDDVNEVVSLADIIKLLSNVNRTNESINHALICLAELVARNDKNEKWLAIEIYQILLTRTADSKEKLSLMISLGFLFSYQQHFSKAFAILKEAKKIGHSGKLHECFNEVVLRCEIALSNACTNGDMEKVKELLAFEHIKPFPMLLMHAVQSKKIEMVKYIDKLLAGNNVRTGAWPHGENVSCTDLSRWNAVHYAAQLDQADILMFLSQSKYADLFDAITGRGLVNGQETTLIVAARYKAYNALQYLIQTKKEQINSRDLNGFTPLAWAYYNKDFKSFSLLIEKGADPNCAYRESLTFYNWWNSTPPVSGLIAHHICEDEQVAYLKCLLESKTEIDLSKRNSEGKSVMGIARYRGESNCFCLTQPTENAQEALSLLEEYRQKQNQNGDHRKFGHHD